MRADYDSKANAISIDLLEAESWEHCEAVGDRVNVAIAKRRPVNVELLYPDMGIEAPLRLAAKRFDLDADTLVAVARAAFAAPDRPVELEIGQPAV